MQFLVFAITYPIIWLLSRLPMKVLYFISDFLFLMIYYVFKYRRNVVLENLELAFPEKTLSERKLIAKKFFKHFTDFFMETIKSLSISKKEILKRYHYENPELVNKHLKKGRSIALVGAHQANWEWSVGSPLVLFSTVNGAYTSLGNPYFDKVVKKARERFGFNCYKSTKTVKLIHREYTNKIQGIYLLLSDQSPQLMKSNYWNEFLGITVPIHTGAEALAKKFNLVVINLSTTKIKRGYYTSKFELITDNSKQTEKHEITDKYIQITEQNIRKQPEFYLWSHKRFKHRNKFKAS